MDLFARESGAVEAPAILFLHGGGLSGWSWQPVVDRMHQYRCLVPDLPEHAKSFEQGPFEMARAAAAVAELVRSRVRTGRAHVAGLSLGAQLGVQLLATEPDVVDRAVLCGTNINGIPGVGLMQPVLALVAWIARFGWVINWNARYLGIPPAQIDEYREDVRLMTGAQLGHIIGVSSRFRIPAGLDKSVSPTLFITGAKETRFVHRSAAALAQRMPNGVNRVAIGMRHDWPLSHPDLFARTLDSWFTGAALPLQIGQPRLRVGAGP